MLHQIEGSLAHLCIRIEKELQEVFEELGEVSYFFIHPGQFQRGTPHLGTAVEKCAASGGNDQRVVTQPRVSCE